MKHICHSGMAVGSGFLADVSACRLLDPRYENWYGKWQHLLLRNAVVAAGATFFHLVMFAVLGTCNYLHCNIE